LADASATLDERSSLDDPFQQSLSLGGQRSAEVRCLLPVR
jgi:hypothetical protein